MKKSKTQFLNVVLKSEKAVFKIGIDTLKHVDSALETIRKPVVSLGHYISKKVDMLQESIDVNTAKIDHVSISNDVHNDQNADLQI